MSDHFSLLGEPRRFWLEEEALKTRFHALTAEHHPDVANQEGRDFSALNVAYQILRDPRARLRHWLELEAPEWTARHLPAPAAVAGLFPQMGKKKQALDEFLKRRAAAGSALAKALLLNEQYALQEELEEWLAVLEAEKEAGLKALPLLDAEWESHPELRADLLPQIAEISQLLGYLDRWAGQTREGIVQLQIG